MKKYSIFGICCLAAIFSATSIYAQQGFTGPSNTRTPQAQMVTVAQAKTFTNETPVVLVGTITQHLGKNKYTFRDTSGEITVEIGKRLVNSITFGPNDRVEITGKADNEWTRNGPKYEIEVRSIRKL